MKVRLGRATAIVAVVSAFLMVFVLPVGIAAASGPDLTPGPTFTLWAYGAVRTVDFAGLSASGYHYQGTATYGYSVVLDQTNLTNQSFELTVNRTMGALLSLEYCYPTCKNPSVTGTVSHHAWESVDAAANFTTNGTVSENGQNVPAIALLNSHSTVLGSLTDSAQGPLRTAYLSVNVSAAANVTFSSPLGLLPDNLTAPSNWSSTSAFVATGTYVIGYSYRFAGPHLTTSVGPVTKTGAVARSGNVTVLGSTNSGPTGTVNLGGTPYVNVSLNVEGPFVAREGFILVPDEIDLFGTGSSSVWGSNETGGTSVQTTSLYVRPNLGPHLGIDGSELIYSASAANPSVTALTSTGVGAAAVSSDADDVGSTPVQGVPISVDQAQGYQGCLVSGTNCPAAAGRPLLPLLGVAVLALVVISAVGVIAVAERRRIPPPTYPNAKLYPPGTDSTPKPLDSGRPPSARRPPPAEDDPLSNLW
jgi:hypothetical protein